MKSHKKNLTEEVMNSTKTILTALLMVVSFKTQALDVEKALAPTIAQAQKWAADAKVVAAVKDGNANNATKYKDMNQDKWKVASIMDAAVKDFTKNAAASFLKTSKSAEVTEVFVNAKDGTKVAFLAKTSGWSHAGKPKHDVPMAGKVWVGKVETDASTGLQQVQFGVPVMDEGKVIGSLVVGVDAAKLK